MEGNFNHIAKIQISDQKSIILISNTSAFILQELLQMFKIRAAITYLTYFIIKVSGENYESYAWTDSGLFSRNRVYHYITNKNRKKTPL